MYDIILKKRNKKELSKEEIEFFVFGYTTNKIPDYQISALLMAVCINGMTDQELINLTEAMINSGESIDLSMIAKPKVDKHSTGGVGDKTTLIIAPIVAACGVSMAKMSGKGLGYTGGTIDKLESIPGFKTDLPKEKFLDIVGSVGAAIIGQSENLVPADKKIYAIRDVTATVESVELIAASVMSKKIASGADVIVLDVKFGSGAFMKTIEEAENLAKKMVLIGKKMQKKVVALLTDMSQPLGNSIGNFLEVVEAVEVLQNKGPVDLTNLCIELASYMICLSNNLEINFNNNFEICLKNTRKQVVDVLKSGRAFDKLLQIVEAQGGDADYIKNISSYSKSKFVHEIVSLEEGYIKTVDAYLCAKASMVLGAGRKTKEDKIDYFAGVVLKNKVGDYVKKGDVLAVLHTNNAQQLKEAESLIFNSVEFCDEKPTKKEIIQKIIF